MKFILFVEGYTEDLAIAEFFRGWLNKRLDSSVGVQTVRFSGWADLVNSVEVRVPMYLDDPKRKRDIIAIVSIIDLYGPTFYPENKTKPKDRYEWAKAYLEGKINHPKFCQHFAVHETEAWLLSDVQIFPQVLQKSIAAKSGHPETVNFDEPPAKLLDKLYNRHLNRGYRKLNDGRNLFAKLNPEVAYEKCPYLKLMLDEMLALAKAAGN